MVAEVSSMGGHSGYTVTRTLWRQQDVVVCRAVADADGRHVLLKVLGPEHVAKDLLRLKREHEVGRTLECAAILQPLALTTVDEMPALACEDFEGLPLEQLMLAPFTLERFFELAIHIVLAVAVLHDQRAVHKDIKPENIYVDTTTCEVKLTGLGLCSRVSRELLSVQPPLLIEGSLPYLSPEQTGRTARAVDNRSDLYSLGVIFYQLLTGRLPWEAKDAFEWIRCHVAKVPPPPISVVPSMAKAVSDIVQKLLAKMPEDRYQTARGLLRDLERCAAEFRRDRHIPVFALGERDVGHQLREPERLYGRQREASLLLGAFERVLSSGGPELVVVTGDPGVGKSALAAELRRPVMRARGLFLSGKFDEKARNIPYSTLAQAFTRLVTDLLAEDEERRRGWKELLRQALGFEARLIADVIPLLRLLIGEPPPVVEPSLFDTESRFRRAFLDFLGVFAHREHPLVLFLDDMQWADTASLRLLEDVVTDPDTRHLLLVGAYRDNETDRVHRLSLTLERIRKTPTPISELFLPPLAPDDVLALVADTVHAARDRARPLANVVCAKTAGNPFFVLHFLSLLYEDRLLWLDETSLTWSWDIEGIEARAYTDNVIDFMLRRLSGLSSATRGALRAAACIGYECEIPILALVYGKSEEETLRDAREAMDVGLVSQTRDRIVFAHDRVQQAVYALVEPARRARMHLEVGRLLWAHLPAEQVEDRLFDIVTQLDLGVYLVTSEAERLRIAELNLRAGRKARAACAYDSAARYLAAGQALLPSGSWEQHYELTYGLCLERARCEGLRLHFDVAFELIAELLPHAHDGSDQLEVAAFQIDLVVVQSGVVPREVDENVLLAITACKKWLGVELTLHPTEEVLRASIERILHDLSDRPIEDIARVSAMTDRVVKAGIELLSKAMPSAYSRDLGLHDLMSATIVSLSVRHGNCEMSPHGYSTFGGTLGRLFERWDDAYRFGQLAARIAEQSGAAPSAGKGRSYFTTAVFINGWTRPIREVIQLLRRSFEASRECGDINVAAFSSVAIVESCLAEGETLVEVGAEAERQLEFTRRMRHYIQGHIDSLYQLVRRLRGQAPPAKAVENLLEPHPHSWAVLQRRACRTIEHFIMSDYRDAAAVAESYRTIAHIGSAADVAFSWYIAALSFSCFADEALPDERDGLRQRVEELEEHHRIWEQRCVVTFRNRRALISAEAARLDGRHDEAMSLYEEAVTTAHRDGFVHNEAIAAELAARFFRMRNLTTVADAYLARARACYLRWGAEAKVAQLDRWHATLSRPDTPVATATLAVRPEQLDMLSLLKASQSISSEIEIDRLVRTLIETVLLQSGAQRALLVFGRDGNLFLEAESVLEQNGLATGTPGRALDDGVSLVPVSLLRYVESSRERVIVNADAADAPAADDYLCRTRPRSVLCFPILKQGKVLGLLYLENRLVAGTFTAERLAAVEVLATQSAISVENALLLTAERTARAAAETAEQRAALLSEASARMAESLDYPTRLVWLSRFCVRSLADWCVIDIVEGKEIVRAAAAHRDPNKEPILRALRVYPPTEGSPHPASIVFCTGEPLLMEDIDEESTRRLCVDEDHARVISALGRRSGVFVPLVARGQVLGVLTLGSATAGKFGRADLELAQDLARRAAVAIDNARLYRASQESVQLREEFVMVASHELRTPLTSLALALCALKRMRPADSTIMPIIERCVRSGARLEKLVADLLEAIKLERGEQPLNRSIVDFGDLVRDVVSRLEPALAREGCQTVVRVREQVVGSWDRVRLDQVVTNLVSNAAKFGAGRPIEIELTEERGAARLVVRDHGIGVAKEQHAHIFERFGRAASATHYGGLGLGLYICRKLVEQHGGTIEVSSHPDEGAAFVVTLPTGSPAPPGTEAHRDNSSGFAENHDAALGY